MRFWFSGNLFFSKLNKKITYSKKGLIVICASVSHYSRAISGICICGGTQVISTYKARKAEYEFLQGKYINKSSRAAN
jgi:hypothetical protein